MVTCGGIIHPPRQVMTNQSQWYINIRRGARLQMSVNVYFTDLHGFSAYEFSNMGYRTMFLETDLKHVNGRQNSSATSIYAVVVQYKR